MKLKKYKISSRTIQYILFISLCLTSLTSCEDYVDLELPPHLVNTDEVFSGEGSAESAVRGIYAYATGSTAITSMFKLVGLASDELEKTSYSTEETMFATNQIAPTSSSIRNIWKGYYNIIYQCNNVIINLEASTVLSDDFKNQLIGEAKFIRAFSYFYLTNLWGDVPLNLQTSYEVSRLLPRVSQSVIYDQIVDDLQDAQTKLSTTLYTNPGERIRANYWAATALLARVHLYNENWAEAEEEASTVINSTLFELETLERTFYDNSKENIIQLANPGSNRYTYVQLVGFSISRPTYRLTSYLSDSIALDDHRRAQWLTPNLDGVHKYKSYSNFSGPDQPEANSMLRLGELYLIRAEARAHQNKLLGSNSAEEDLNTIRQRAGLGATPATTQEEFLEAIFTERTRELFGEWGHRWFDVIRTGQADTIFGTHKASWESEAALFPIPYDDLQKNPNLTQNTGY
ncbi:RagB/SusD family nutrient uptake outer membrane protein [Flavobacteriaceae bacterium F08102]|nr:RagB/SusD family nutrient uptake outer membrane protein [Flavobacteriaceae bacterium F08102]